MGLVDKGSMPERISVLVTPSPFQEEAKRKKSSRKSARKQLFDSGEVNTKKWKKTEDQGKNGDVRKELFPRSSKTDETEQESVPCSTAPRIPVEWLLKQKSSSLLGKKSETRSKTAPEKASAVRRRKKQRTRQRLLTSFDSLASVCSVSSKSMRKQKAVKRDSTNNLKESKSAPPPKRDPKGIPAELVSVLTPLGIPKPRTSLEVLQDEASWRQQRKKPTRKRKTATRKRKTTAKKTTPLPTRKRIPRACKDTSRSYLEESDDEEEKKDLSYESSNTEPCDDTMSVREKDGSYTHTYAFKKRNGSDLAPTRVSRTRSLHALEERNASSTDASRKSETRGGPSGISASIENTSPALSTTTSRNGLTSVNGATSDLPKRKPPITRERKLEVETQKEEASDTETSEDSSLQISSGSFSSSSGDDGEKESSQINREKKSTNNGSHHQSNTMIGSVVKVMKGKLSKKDSSKRTKKNGNKVRFAPLPATTTTFSVKIRVKTRPSPTRKSKQGGEQIPVPQSLSESAVQSIANQITQACLSQASNVGHPIGGEGHQNEGTEGVKDGSGEEESCDSDIPTSSDGTDLEYDASRDAFTRGSVRNKSKPPKKSTRQTAQERSQQNANYDWAQSVSEDAEVGSVVSKLSMNSAWGKEISRKERLESQDSKERMSGGKVEDERPKGSARSQGVSSRVKTKVVGQVADDLTSPSNASFSSTRRKRLLNCSDSLAGLLESKSLKQSKQKAPPRKRSRRTLLCSDSLAGSLASFAPASESFRVVTPKVPREVSVNKTPPKRSPKRFSPEEASKKPVGVEIDETVVTADSGSPRRKKHCLERCGKCSGCLRSYDCFTCVRCIKLLQEGRYSGGESGCLKRMCQLTQKQMHVESLGNSKESRQPKHVMADDWSTSCFSASSNPASRKSRKARLWKQSLTPKRKPASGSVSSYTASIKNGDDQPIPRKSRRGRKGKKKKNPLHDLELPLPTDGSVASWMNERRNLRALLYYDEADQDWV